MGEPEQPPDEPGQAANWPVFLWRPMVDDARLTVGIGARVSWNVQLVDADVNGWPTWVARDVSFRLSGPPRGFSRGLVAQIDGAWVAWGGDGQIGDRLRVNGTLEVDSWNPRLPCVVHGVVGRILVALPVSDKSDEEGAAKIQLISGDRVGGAIGHFGSLDSPLGWFAILSVDSIGVDRDGWAAPFGQ